MKGRRQQCRLHLNPTGCIKEMLYACVAGRCRGNT
jgi:hypothetical protein